ncbi:isocitrate lyase/PEP mutase family protein [Ferruginibacter sp.]
MNHYKTFLSLHHAPTPLLLGNSWDAGSAKLLAQNGFKAIATSSAAVAQSYGYEDGEKMPFELLLQTVKRIQQNIALPLSVDMEHGFSNTTEGIVENIQQLHQLGVVGINLEDSVQQKLEPAETFAKRMEIVANKLMQKNIPLFINARTDAFLLQQPDALQTTLQRIQLYQTTGVNGIFVPFIKQEQDIAAVTAATTLPVNILPVPGLPNIEQLTVLGVKRISLGSSLYNAFKRTTTNTIQSIMEQQTFEALF